MSLEAENMRYSYKDYLSWSRKEKYELIDGIPYTMSPSPSRTHQEVSMRLVNEIYNYLKYKKCKVYKTSDNGLYGEPEIYGEKDVVKVGILEALNINLKENFFIEMMGRNVQTL